MSVLDEIAVQFPHTAHAHQRHRDLHFLSPNGQQIGHAALAAITSVESRPLGPWAAAGGALWALGFGIEAARPAVELAHETRTSPVISGTPDEMHVLLRAE